MKHKKRIYTVLTVMALFLTGLATLYNENTTVQAGKLCSQMGIGMDIRNPIKTDGMINADKGPRKWTVEELFKGSARFTSYFGEGEGSWLLSDKVDRGKGRNSLWEDETVKSKLEDPNIRNTMRCLTAGLETSPGNLMLSLSSGITWVTKSTMSGLFAGNIFGTGKGMIDIAGMIGGANNSDKGVIGVLTSSIYTPLVVIAFVIAAVNIMWKGLLKRQFRQALGDILWSLGAFVIGVLLMYNPQMLSNAPQKVTTEISNCLVAGLNGESCFSNQPSEKPSMLVGTECLSSVGGDKKGVDMLVNGLTCGVWKSFVMEPWAQAQFGHSYKDLYTMNPPEGGTIWEGLQTDGSEFCVSLGTSKPASDFDGKTVKVDQGPSVCNVALYQMYLGSDVHDTSLHSSDFPKASDDYDVRWYDIITTMAKDESNWYRWAGVYQGPIRGFAAFTGLIGTIAASFLLITLSLMGMGYQIAGTLMMAFAPLFFLLAIIPNRGKRMFLGWLEVVVSSVLKYMATALFAVVSLVLYSAILANTTGMTALIGVVVLSGTMYAYRKEVVDIIGAANMGGKRLSNRFNKIGEKTKNMASAAVGGAVGAKMAGGTLTEGASATAKRQLKRGNSMTAQMFKQYDRTSSDLLKKERDIQAELQQKSLLDKQMEAKVEAASGLSEEDREYIRKQRENDKNNDNPGGKSNDVEVDVEDKRERKGTISKAQLEKIEELRAMSDKDLANIIDNGDEEEHTLGIEELNRRMTLQGDNADPSLSMNPLVDPSKLSNRQLNDNIKKFREDYLIEGKNLESLESNLAEYNERNDLGSIDDSIANTKAKRERIVNGEENAPVRTTPRDEDLREDDDETKPQSPKGPKDPEGGGGSSGAPVTPGDPRTPSSPGSSHKPSSSEKPSESKAASENEESNSSKVTSATDKPSAPKATSATDKPSAPKTTSATDKPSAPKTTSATDKPSAPKTTNVTNKSKESKVTSATSKAKSTKDVDIKESSIKQDNVEAEIQMPDLEDIDTEVELPKFEDPAEIPVSRVDKTKPKDVKAKSKSKLETNEPVMPTLDDVNSKPKAPKVDDVDIPNNKTNERSVNENNLNESPDIPDGPRVPDVELPDLDDNEGDSGLKLPEL